MRDGKSEHGFSGIEALLIVLVIAALTAVGLVVYQRHKPSRAKNSTAANQTQSTTQSQNTATSRPGPDPYAGWQTYSNSDVSLKYPSEWTVSAGQGQDDRAAATSPAFTNSAVDDPSTQINLYLRLSTDSQTIDCWGNKCQISATAPLDNPQLPGAVLAIVNQISNNGTHFTEYVVTGSGTKVGDTSISPVKTGTNNIYIFGQAYYTPKDNKLSLAAMVTDPASFQADSHFRDLISLINGIRFK